MNCGDKFFVQRICWFYSQVVIKKPIAITSVLGGVLRDYSQMGITFEKLWIKNLKKS